MTQRVRLPRGPTRWPLSTLLALAVATLVAWATRKPLPAGSSTVALAHINDTQGRHLPVEVSHRTRPTGQLIRDVRTRDVPVDPGRDDHVGTHVGMLKGSHRYRSFAAEREMKVAEQSVTEVVEAVLRRGGTMRRRGNVVAV